MSDVQWSVLLEPTTFHCVCACRDLSHTHAIHAETKPRNNYATKKSRREHVLP